MANIFITNDCNLNCGYCFAKGLLGDSRVYEMSLDEIDAVIRRMPDPPSARPPGNKMISLLGGEPTRHSKFPEIIDHLLGRGYAVKLFTNGTFSSETCGYLSSLPSEKINIILNINRKENHTARNWSRIEHNLSVLHDSVTLGLTIADPEFEYAPLVDAINRHALRRDIRLGISVPIVNASNAFVRFPDYIKIGARIVEFSGVTRRENITLGFDCGFIMCMFTRNQLGKLQLNNAVLNFKCDGAIDIGRGGRIWRCFPLYGIYNTSLDKFDSMDGIKDYYNDVLPRKEKGISGRCGTCGYYLTKSCSGGCYGFEFI